jgi:cyclophilin family peptidyl-prolyl cis-trans isomerase
VAPDQARPLVLAALADPDWAVRRRAAAIARALTPPLDGAAERPAATRRAPAEYGAASIVAPSYSPHAYLETAKGTIEIELAVLDAPLTVANFMSLATSGFFSRMAIHRVVPNFVVQAGDNRGDGSGGPGYTIRDELNLRPYLRGTVGMALAGPDTGGSQWFITHGPQPHLDARYTVFGRVVAGMDVVDRLARGDVIERVRIWDGTAWQGR